MQFTPIIKAMMLLSITNLKLKKQDSCQQIININKFNNIVPADYADKRRIN